MALINTYYFASKDVKVFPSSFRGTYAVEAGADEIVFDPESRLNTEANFILPKPMLGKSTYILEYNQSGGTIKFMLGGYYFEISNLTNYIDSLKDQLIGITTRSVNFDVDSTYDGTRTSHVLDSWITGNDNLLDKFTDINSKQSYFTGLKVLTTEDTATSSIKLFNNDGTVNQTYMLANIDHGTGSNTLMHGTGLTAGYTNQTVFGKHNYNKSDSIFEIGKGTDSSNKANALEISATTTTINNNTNINGNTEIIGNTTITGTATVTSTTTIQGTVGITNNTESTSTTTGALKVTGGVGIGTNLNVGGNTNLGSVTKTDNSTTPATTTTTPLVTIKNAPSTSEPNVKIDGTLTVTRKTDIYGNATIDSNKTTLAKPVEITDTSDDALIVKGKTTIEKDLEVGDDTKVLAVKNSPSDGEQNVTITGTLKSTDKATFGNGLEVASGKTTNLGGQVNITGAVNINTSSTVNPGATTIYGATTITGATAITGTVTITGKATSTATATTDGSTTLTTKGYVDGKFDALDFTTTSDETIAENATGSYLQSVNQTNGKVTTKKYNFDTTISSSSTNNNAPTSKAVNDFISDKLSKISVAKVGGSNTYESQGKQITDYYYINSIDQANGIITATAKTLTTDLSSDISTDEGIASAKATKQYIESTKSKLETQIDDVEKKIPTIPAEYSNIKVKQPSGNNQYVIWTHRAAVPAGSWSAAHPLKDFGKKIVAVSVTGILESKDVAWREWNITDATDKDDAENTLGYAANFYAYYSSNDSGVNLYVANANAKYDGIVDIIAILEK